MSAVGVDIIPLVDRYKRARADAQKFWDAYRQAAIREQMWLANAPKINQLDT
jgi:hypothetical protein